jgi:hypothetical protein
MKKLITACAFATLLASSAIAVAEGPTAKKGAPALAAEKTAEETTTAEAPSVFADAEAEAPAPTPERDLPPGPVVNASAPTMMGPAEMDYSGGEIPEGYQLESRINKGLVIAGASTFGGVYIFNCLGAAIAYDASEGDKDAYTPLFIPVAGPFVTIHTADATATGTFGLVVDGLAQAAGLSMFIAGLAAQEDVLVWRGSYGSVRADAGPGGAQLSGNF